MSTFYSSRAATSGDDDDQRHDSSASRPTASYPNSRVASDADSDDDEDAWDEVDVAQDNRASTLAAAAAAAAGTEAIEIVISKGGKKGKTAKKKPDGSTTRERMIRQERHKTHTICLLAVGLIRNNWLNDPLLKARLLSIVPLHLQNAFSAFNRSSHPNERDRSRLFDHALKDLLSWWYQSFEIDDRKGLFRRTVADVDLEIAEWRSEPSTSKVPWGIPLDESDQEEQPKRQAKKKESASSARKGKGRARDGPRTPSVVMDEEVHSAKTLMKHALQMSGSRDMSVQLFTCLCRALDLPARLVFSLQPVDWRALSAGAGTGKKKKGPAKETEEEDATSTDTDRKRRAAKGKGRAGPKPKSKLRAGVTIGSAKSSERDDSGDERWEDGRGRLNYTVPKVNLRRTKVARRDVNRSPSPDSEEMTRRPAFWTEVWTRSNRHWIPVDPSRKKMRCRGIMEPSRTCVENQMLYVVAFEEDSSARDVTPRYAKNFNTFTAKARVPSKKGTDWFADLLKPHHRTFQLNRDREEEEELWQRKANEPMPTSVAGFKNHPTFVLEQHLHRDEVILPNAKRLGMFRGVEHVYSRSAVVQLKSEENWRRVGRIVSDDEVPMKWVKQRSVTINRKRAENAVLFDGGEVAQQGLYAEGQTEVYVPPPVKDGKIPKNGFGNIDLYVPSMLPAGAIHLPHKGAAKAAKALGIDYAEAVTGFEFRQRRANPILSGVVVAEENADLLVEAIINTQEAADEKEFAKRQDRVLKRWKKLIVGLRIRQRLQASYHQEPKKVTPQEEESQFGGSAPKPRKVVPPPPPPPRQEVQRPQTIKLIVTPSSKPAQPSAGTSRKRAAPPAPTPFAPPPKRTLRSATVVPPAPPRSPSPEAAAPPARDTPGTAANRSTSGRTLRFTMSTEEAVGSKEEREKAEEEEEEEEEEKVEKAEKAESVVTETEVEVEEDDGVEDDYSNSESSLEFLSDF